MAVLFLLLAMIGGALVGDLAWESTGNGEVTVLGRTVTGYPQGWLLAAAAAIGFAVALVLVASMSSTKTRRRRRRQLRSMKRDLEDQGFEPEHASWLDEPGDRQETGTDPGAPLQRQSEPLYEQTRRTHLRDDRRQGSTGSQGPR
jgi:hypothetical protein